MLFDSGPEDGTFGAERIAARIDLSPLEAIVLSHSRLGPCRAMLRPAARARLQRRAALCPAMCIPTCSAAALQVVGRLVPADGGRALARRARSGMAARSEHAKRPRRPATRCS